MRGKPFFHAPLPLNWAAISSMLSAVLALVSNWAIALICAGRVLGQVWGVILPSRGVFGLFSGIKLACEPMNPRVSSS